MNKLPTVLPIFKKQEKIFGEFGPWQVDDWGDGKIVLQSVFSENDVALIINGDFTSLEDKYEYAIQLASRMNIGLRLISPNFLNLESTSKEYSKSVYNQQE